MKEAGVRIMSTLILDGELAPSELYKMAYDAGRCGHLLDTWQVQGREDVDLDHLMDEYEQGWEQQLLDVDLYEGD